MNLFFNCSTLGQCVIHPLHCANSMFEFRSGGRRVSQQEFFRKLQSDVVDAGMKELQQRVHAVAASIVDPETGKHAEVFVRRNGSSSLALRTSGSAAFARELEKRLGIEKGSVEMTTLPVPKTFPRVYLAHASEDHNTLAKPLAEAMLAKGIEVWFDEWEIRTGDSLRRKMEEGLGTCTHFVVLLTPRSLHKPWVETEIDAGFVRAIDKESRFMGIRVGVGVKDLSPFLRTLRCPEINLEDAGEVEGLIADIHGASQKPQRGAAPHYVKPQPEGLKAWAASAVAVAEYLVRNSKLGRHFDPQARAATVAEATGLPEEDIRLGVLDLEGAGLIKRSLERNPNASFGPTIGLFVEFDQYFLEFNPKTDAVSVANWLVSQEIQKMFIEELAKHFPDWSPRRLNSALNYLDDAKLIDSFKALNSGDWCMSHLRITDHTRRFVRDHG
ncbi:toll/interleukin-1 receptor domain-containing protein [Reyranella sp.]|uniref:toll/interleukin-1 receptor domain-containing protein n=1 Tax=Reyranella sp. TaxID=1929291 RepID=UPI00378437C7